MSQDLLHLFPDGLLRSEAAWLIYTLAKLGLSVATINQAIASYHHWPEDVRIPELSDKLEKGKDWVRTAECLTLPRLSKCLARR